MKSWLREPIMALGICCSFSLTWRAPNHQQTSNRKSLRIDTGMYSRQKRHVGLASMTPDTRFCKKKHYDQFQTSDPSWWLHQPIWKYHSNCIISPILGMKATTIWNHQLGLRKWPAKSQEQRQMCIRQWLGLPGRTTFRKEICKNTPPGNSLWLFGDGEFTWPFQGRIVTAK